MSSTDAKVLLTQCSVVACGTLRGEIRRLGETGFLDPDKLLFTAPGLHEWPAKLASQLTRQMEKALGTTEYVIVVYGESCYYNFETSTDTDGLLAKFAPRVARVRAKTCVDMLADREERENIAGQDKVYWFTPGWIEHWDFIFKEWDIGKANETFPVNDKGIVLDALGYFDELSLANPEKILEICDWMKMPLEGHNTSLRRMEDLLMQCAEGFAKRPDGQDTE